MQHHGGYLITAASADGIDLAVSAALRAFLVCPVVPARVA
jgi:hypothetical protein